MSRVARVERMTDETQIMVELDLDGIGVSRSAPVCRSSTTCWPNWASTAAWT